MPRPLSMDLRERIAEAVNAGLSRSAAARRFAVAPSSAIKLMRSQAQTGSLAPKRMGGYRAAILAPHEATVRALVEETPDATLEELRLALRKRKIKVGRSALSAFLAKLRLTVKKNSARQRAGSARCSRGAHGSHRPTAGHGHRQAGVHR